MAFNRFLLVFVCLLPGLGLASASALQEASQLLRQGEQAQALTKINSHLVENPKDAQGRFLKGLILAELDRAPEAIKVFSELTDDYPELPEPYNNLAVLYAAQGQYERAKQSLEMAIRTHPSYATAHENLGDIYAKMASAAYDKALQLDKSNVSAQTKLALIKEIFSPASIERVKPATPASAKPTPPSQPPAVAQGSGPGRSTAEVKTAAAGKPSAVAVKANPGNPGTDTSKAEIEKTVKDWAAAWSRQDVAAYLGFYAAAYAPAGLDRAQWEEQRRDRITKPVRIRVGISQLAIRVDGDKASVSFRQDYASDRYRDWERKTLALENQGGVWKIVEER